MGGRTVQELSDTMTVAEFVRWQAYEKIFPWGLDDLFFARLMQLLVSINTPKGKSRPKLHDFLLGDWPEHAPAPEELEAKFDMLVQQAGLQEFG